MAQVDRLHAYLDARPSGLVDPGVLVPLLVAAWPGLTDDAKSTTWASRFTRVDQPIWDPPVLRFDLQQFNETTREAHVERWEVDTSTATARRVSTAPVVAVRAAEKPVRIAATVAELMTAIEDGRDDPRLHWRADRSAVRIDIGATLPITNRETTTARRQRFAAALREAAAARGWREIQRYTFEIRD